jgi:hypothetical protein
VSPASVYPRAAETAAARHTVWERPRGSLVTVQHENLLEAGQVEETQAFWKERVSELGQILKS